MKRSPQCHFRQYTSVGEDSLGNDIILQVLRNGDAHFAELMPQHLKRDMRPKGFLGRWGF